MISPTYLLNYLGDIKGDVFSIYRTLDFPRNHRADGYGDQIPTEYMVKYGSRTYRVYAICWSNVASFYIRIKGIQYFIHDYDLDGIPATKDRP